VAQRWISASRASAGSALGADQAPTVPVPLAQVEIVLTGVSRTPVDSGRWLRAGSRHLERAAAVCRDRRKLRMGRACVLFFLSRCFVFGGSGCAAGFMFQHRCRCDSGRLKGFLVLEKR
jgi:hypothetical protein